MPNGLKRQEERKHEKKTFDSKAEWDPDSRPTDSTSPQRPRCKHVSDQNHERSLYFSGEM